MGAALWRAGTPRNPAAHGSTQAPGAWQWTWWVVSSGAAASSGHLRRSSVRKLTTAVAAFRATAAPVALTVPLLVLVVTASVLESGMFDTTPAFVLFFTLALVTHRVPEGRATS